MSGMRRGTWCSPPHFFWLEENVAKAGVETVPMDLEDIITRMKITEAQLREIIREEVIREQRETLRQEMLREGLLDAIKSAIGSGEESGSNVKASAGFAAIAKLFSGLAERISSDVNKMQTALPASEEPTDAVGIAHAIINGFISGGLGSLGQMNKDLGLIGSAFSAAAKTVDSDPEGTKKKLMAQINDNLGKATSSG